MAVFFTHIPKTGGTSIRSSLLEKNIEEADIRRPQGYRDLIFNQEPFKCYIGHHPYGVHKLTPMHESPQYYTMLRDPVERAISFYYECLWPRAHEKVSQHPKHPIAWKNDLVSFCRMPRFRNVQTRMLAGILPEYVGRYVSIDQPGVSKYVLALAKRNLTERYTAFGLTERFEESMKWMSVALGWQWKASGTKRAAYPDRPRACDLKKSERDTLEDLNRLDSELHEFATRLFKKKTAGFK